MQESDVRPCPGRPPRRDVLRLAMGAPVLLGLVPWPALPLPMANAASGIAGKIVFLDPGHNGANDGSIGRQVPTGRGGTKECQTTGTTTDAGYPEHTFNWNTVLMIRQELNNLGVRTAMSRGNDNALGPCVDERAYMANALHPDAMVSIHADGGPAGGQGFSRELLEPSAEHRATGCVGPVRPGDARPDGGGGPATVDVHGQQRTLWAADLTGLNLAQYPSILVECGNMKNAGDAAMLASQDGQAHYANAVARGIASYLGGT